MVMNKTNNNKSYKAVIDSLNQNSANYDNASIIKEYISPDVKYYHDTENKVSIFDNMLIGKYKYIIAREVMVKQYTLEQSDYYRFKPERVSIDEYGTSSLWYLILFFNDFEDIWDFQDFTYLKIPNLEQIKQLMQNEEFINKKKAEVVG